MLHKPSRERVWSRRQMEKRAPAGPGVAGPSAPKPVDWLGLYLREDIGAGDITADAIFPAQQQGRARIVARERLLVAGTSHAMELFHRLGAQAEVQAHDGSWVERGATVLGVSGPVRSILAGERVALNLLSRMSGIAGMTHELAQRLAQARLPAKVTATRKTTPGFRAFEKEAVRIGGGDPHRLGLWDAAMV
jgi:nicotinate-nucleotide pyrophosphorylase (carboxylating)